MACTRPLQATFYTDDNGKKRLTFKSPLLGIVTEQLVREVAKPSDFKDFLLRLPCGRCLGCRLERSRQWAMRCMHEAQMHEANCFLTLTYNNQNLPCGSSLQKSDFQKFMKRLRKFFGDKKLRYFQCGEYGENFGRPHYHLCLFGADFEDKKVWKKCGESLLYISDSLTKIWSLGFATIGSLTFESAAYVARYCTKKITGKDADQYYQGRLPEYASMSLKPGIGATWYDAYKDDVYPSDQVIVRKHPVRPPRFYDKLLEREAPSLFLKIKEKRLRKLFDNEEDMTYSRLQVKEKCLTRKFEKLIRIIEKESYAVESV